jgi:predicted flavoprotein YhiN
MHEKLVVIGGGAAGFFCAVNAARLHPGLQVLLVEKSNKLLAKVKVLNYQNSYKNIRAVKFF